MNTIRKDKQRHRMIRYFVEAAWEIIDSEGVDALTVRRVADLAGYNVATLYNYFDNLDHLKFFASLRILKDYAEALPKYVKDVEDPIAMYMKTWECFNLHAFSYPEAYMNIFFSDNTVHYNKSISLFYEIFPEQLPDDGLQFVPMYTENDLHKRDYRSLKAAADADLFSEEDIIDISRMNSLMFCGMIHHRIIKPEEMSLEEAIKTVTGYQARTLITYGIDPERLSEYL